MPATTQKLICFQQFNGQAAMKMATSEGQVLVGKSTYSLSHEVYGRVLETHIVQLNDDLSSPDARKDLCETNGILLIPDCTNSSADNRASESWLDAILQKISAYHTKSCPIFVLPFHNSKEALTKEKQDNLDNVVRALKSYIAGKSTMRIYLLEPVRPSQPDSVKATFNDVCTTVDAFKQSDQHVKPSFLRRLFACTICGVSQMQTEQESDLRQTFLP